MAASLPPSASTDNTQRLRNLLQSATSAADVLALCPTLEAEARHQPRAFFRLCFPLLLRRIFGYDDLQTPGLSSPSPSTPTSSASVSPSHARGGWLALVSLPGNEVAAQALVTLLAPTETLFRSLLSADKENFVRYVFPGERLPDWVRRLLAAPRGPAILSEVSVLFKNRLKELPSGSVQVELDVFQYYMFWFAYYAICKDLGFTHTSAARRQKSASASRSIQLRTHIEHWASSFPGLHHSLHHGPSVPSHPYLHLLQLYLSYFVCDPLAKKGFVGGSPWLARHEHASILVHTLMDFWLIDDDPLPVPLSVRQSLHIHLQAEGGVLSYIPPGVDLTDALKQLIAYFNSVMRTSVMGGKDLNMVFFEDSAMSYRRKGLISSGMGSVLATAMSSGISSPIAPYFQSLQRPLYRFLLRAFRFWPVGSPIKNISQLVDVWVDFLEPWESVEGRLAAQQLPKIGGDQKPSSDHSWGSPVLSTYSGVSEKGAQYSVQWQGYVVANYLFYTSLVVHFLELALKFVDVDSEMIIHLVFKVLNVLAKSKELLETLQKLDVAVDNHFTGRPDTYSNALNDSAPRIREQLLDWEEGMVSNTEKALMIGCPTTKEYPLRFFSSNEVGACHILQSLILHTESEAQASKGRSSISEQGLKGLEDAARAIFDLKTASDENASLREANFYAISAGQGGHKALAGPLGLQRHSWAEVKYKGDWMRRPIESKEVAFLVRFLVKLSDSINDAIGLSLENQRDIGQGQNHGIQESMSSLVSQVEGIPVQHELELSVPDLFREIQKLVKRFCLFLQQEIRSRGWRVNLRFVAERQFLGLMFTVLFMTWMSMKITRLFLAVVSG